MAAAPHSQSFLWGCSCMKNGWCVQCACVKREQLCVDCWPSKIKLNRCMNSVHTAQGSTVNSAPIYPPAVVSQPATDHQSTNDSTYQLPIETTQQLASEFTYQSSTESIQLQPNASTCIPNRVSNFTPQHAHWGREASTPPIKGDCHAKTHQCGGTGCFTKWPSILGKTALVLQEVSLHTCS